jgi:hypothetical protein
MSDLNEAKKLANKRFSEKFLQLKQPSFRRAIFWASVWLLIFWLIHKRWLSAMPPLEQISGFDNLAALRLKFFESGWIPYAISLSFLIGLHYLWQISNRLLRPLGLSNTMDQRVIDAAKSDDHNALIILLNKEIEAGNVGYYTKRFAKLIARWEREEDTGVVIALKNEILETDEENIAIAFTTVSWAEWTLPLLGFLGTVVGIGGAIGSVQNGVSMLFAREKLDPDVLTLFTQGFKGLALAFDTTFHGLACLIIVGGLHFLLRRRLASNLAVARQIFSEFVAKWFAVKNDPIVIAVGDLKSQTAQLEDRIDRLKEAVEISDQRATNFREEIKRKVEHIVVESPNLDWVRKALFVPVVEFNQVGLNLATEAVNIINNAVGHKSWKFTALGVAGSGSHAFVAGVEDRKKPDAHWIFSSDLDVAADEERSQGLGNMTLTKLRLRCVFPASDLKTLFAETQDGDLMPISLPTPDSEKPIVTGLQVEEPLFPAVIDKRNLILIVRRTAVGFKISCSDFASPKEPEHIHNLQGNMTRALWTFHDKSAQLFAVVQEERRWRLYTLRFSSSPTEQRDNGKPDEPSPSKLACESSKREIPVTLIPKQVVALSPDEVLLVDREGEIHYWDKARSVPIRLRHASWPSDPDLRVTAGPKGWIAVSARGHLTMWRIHRGGHLYPYEKLPEGFAIDGLDTDSLITTSDGHYLLGIGKNLISTWEFPRYAVDELN